MVFVTACRTLPILKHTRSNHIRPNIINQSLSTLLPRLYQRLARVDLLETVRGMYTRIPHYFTHSHVISNVHHWHLYQREGS